ncbi:hypothetical protein Q8F55_000088 [Vanrija albida]|uniref:Uncharacterized protein n=1 Tax=Vanrija albida TaxID=181172 RepID=A0ABR3QCA0_9TREE
MTFKRTLSALLKRAVPRRPRPPPEPPAPPRSPTARSISATVNSSHAWFDGDVAYGTAYGDTVGVPDDISRAPEPGDVFMGWYYAAHGVPEIVDPAWVDGQEPGAYDWPWPLGVHSLGDAAIGLPDSEPPENNVSGGGGDTSPPVPTRTPQHPLADAIVADAPARTSAALRHPLAAAIVAAAGAAAVELSWALDTSHWAGVSELTVRLVVVGVVLRRRDAARHAALVETFDEWVNLRMDDFDAAFRHVRGLVGQEAPIAAMPAALRLALVALQCTFDRGRDCAEEWPDARLVVFEIKELGAYAPVDTIAGLQSPAVTLAAAASVAWAEVNAAYTSGAWYGVSPLAVQLFVVHLVFVDRDEARSARLEYESFDEFETARMERFDAVYSWVSANLPVVPDSVATLGLTLMALQYTHTGEGGEWPADRWVPYVRSMLGTYAAVQWWDRS